MLSASQLKRAEACPASEALPQTGETNEWSAAGTRLHTFLERVAQVGRDVALAEAPEEDKERFALIDLGPLPVGCGSQQEVAFAYDPATGTARVIQLDSARGYAGLLRPGELPGTADVVAVGPTSVMVGDYKSDHGHDETAPSPERNFQLQFLGLAAARAFGRDAVVMELYRVSDDGSVRVERAGLDAFQLEDVAARIAKLVTRVAAAQVKGAQLQTMLGAHCRYCPARQSCPAQVGLIQQLAGGHWPQPITQENARLAFETWTAAKKGLGLFEGQLKAWAKDFPVDLGDGTEWTELPSSKESLDGAVVADVLEQIHGRDVARAAVTLEATKTSLEKALKPVAVANKSALAPLKRDALRAVAEAGGITTKSSHEWGTRPITKEQK